MCGAAHSDGNNNTIEIDSTDDEYQIDTNDFSFRCTPEKTLLNESMKNLDKEWTPLKYQLGSNLSNIDKRSKQHVVNKAMKAIDTILEKIAPGQSSELKEECFQQQNRKDEESQLLGCLTQALKEALNQHAKIQLLSIVCRKDSADQYIYKQNKLVEMFQGISLNDVKKARQNSANTTPGAPIEPGKYTRKKLKDAQINHFLDFLQHVVLCKMW